MFKKEKNIHKSYMMKIYLTLSILFIQFRLTNTVFINKFSMSPWNLIKTAIHLILGLPGIKKKQVKKPFGSKFG